MVWLCSVKVELKDVKEKWLREQGPYHIRSITEHYGIYSDLFGTAFFYNTTPMSVCYDYDEEFVTPVYYGNKIPPSEVRHAHTCPSACGEVHALVDVHVHQHTCAHACMHARICTNINTHTLALNNNNNTHIIIFKYIMT